ncbi:MAG: hypothetical protein ABSE73_18105 [Planctomycetota bacterium]
MGNQRMSDEEVKRLRAAGIPVPETLDDMRKLLEEGERSGPAIPAEEAFRKIRRQLRARLRARQHA